MPRSLTPAEKREYQGVFPNLDVGAVVVTGEATSIYNGVPWTVGVTNRWLWHGPTIQQFDIFYRQFGYIRVGNGLIAAWGHSTSGMTHGAISGPARGPRWESKCGAGLRLQHGLDELVGSSYGRMSAFYGRSLSFAPLSAKTSKALRQ
jgi:hypothetical protein